LGLALAVCFSGVNLARRLCFFHQIMGGCEMNKSELIDAIAAEADLSKVAAGNALSATIKAVTGALKKGERLSLVGFGSFWVGERAARTGRNPQTGKPLKIKAARVPKFTPGKALKELVNKKK
jgi:DNA-binding protein HU-beta